MRLGIGALKSITPFRPPSLALQVAPKLVPGWAAAGLLSTMTLPAGAESKLNRIRNPLVTSCAKTSLNLASTSKAKARRKETFLFKGELGQSAFIGRGLLRV